MATCDLTTSGASCSTSTGRSCTGTARRCTSCPAPARCSSGSARPGRPLALFTNGSHIPPAGFAAGLREAGLEVADDELLTPLSSVRTYLRAHHEATVLLFGTDAAREYLVASGIGIVDGDPREHADAVLVTHTDVVDFAELERGARAILGGARLLTGSYVPAYAGANGPIFSRGAMLTAALAKVTGRRPVVVGKPSRAAVRTIVERLGVPASELVVIGDDLDLDIALGRLGGSRGRSSSGAASARRSTSSACPSDGGPTRWSTASPTCSTGSEPRRPVGAAASARHNPHEVAATVIGRGQELGVIEALLTDAGLGPRALLLSGEAGIGKTVLWETGVEDARSRLGTVLTCRGVEAEASLSFTGLSELLGDVLGEVGPSLAPPRRRALEVALLLVEPGETAPDPHAIGLAVLDVLRALSEQAPVLVALDDVQWLDPASAGALQIAFRRLRDEPIVLLATLRLGPDLASPVELERSFPNERLERLTVGPLTLAAVRHLLEERLGLELTRPELARVQEATAGNPFFALELGRELVRTNTRPAPGQPLRVPESLSELLGGRLARLPGETLDVLLLVAALARPTVEVVAATYGERERVLGRSRRPRRRRWSSWTTRTSASRIRSSDRSATSARRCGSAKPCTGLWRASSRTSRSVPAIWRSPQTAPTRGRVLSRCGRRAGGSARGARARRASSRSWLPS